MTLILCSNNIAAVLVDNQPPSKDKNSSAMTSKITRAVELWQSKSFITTTDAVRINEYIPPPIEADYADNKVLTSPYLHSEILVNKSSVTDKTSLSSYTATTLDSGGQSQEQLLKLQQIQQIQDQIQEHIAKLN